MVILIVIAILAVLGPVTAAEAHKPRIIEDQQVTIVRDPDVSQAFYGQLNGRPAHFIIDSSAAVSLYSELTVANNANSGRDWRLTISGNNLHRSITSNRWRVFDEPFGGDSYLIGPQFQGAVSRPRITVSRPGNQGRYILVIGRAESFTPIDAVKAVYQIALIRRYWFNHSWPSAIIARPLPLALLLLMPLFLLLCLILIWLRRR